LSANRPGEHVAAGLRRLVAPLAREPLPNLVARPRGLHELQPVALGVGVLVGGGDHLDRVAVVQRRVKRHQPTVDLRAHGLVADVGVNRVGEVDGRRSLRELEELSSRREHVHLGAGDLSAQRVEEVAGIGGLLLPVRNLAKPPHVVRHGGDLLAPRVLLVAPVCGVTVLGPLVHLPRANLQLHRLALRPNHRRVQ